MTSEFITLSRYAKDITGQRFGRLVALGPVGKTPQKQIVWLCQCECGTQTNVSGASLRFGATRSCGCLQREKWNEIITKHGLVDSPVYQTWAGIIRRCTNPSEKAYKNYGGRGISICKEWKDSFENFHAHVRELPHFGEEGYSLDRIFNDGNYEPGNIKWSTRTEQNRNSRNARLVTANNITKCVAAWKDETGIPEGTIRKRLKMGWLPEKAVTTLVRTFTWRNK